MNEGNKTERASIMGKGRNVPASRMAFLSFALSAGGFAVLWIQSRMLGINVVANVREAKVASSTFNNKYSLPILANGQNASYTPSHCYGSLPKVPAPGVRMTDREKKFSIMGIPKGGATVSAQVAFRHLELMETALAYNPWIHNYRVEVFEIQPNHRPAQCDKFCVQPGWTCVKIVRSIIDRAMSAYIHSMITEISDKDYFPELHDIAQEYGLDTGKNASFTIFLKAVRARTTDFRRSFGDDHFLPQADAQCDIPGVYHVPLEAIDEGFRLINQTNGVFFNSTGLTSSHYVSKNDSSTFLKSITNIPHLPFPDLFNGHRKLKFSYDDFFSDPITTAEFCQLYCVDFQLYANMCKQPFLASNGRIQEACKRERSRILNVCGPVYDYF